MQAGCLFLIILVMIFVLISRTSNADITSTVVDANPEMPIEGAVVLVEWSRSAGFPGMISTKSYKVLEVPVPVVIAGGKKLPEMDALLMTEGAIKAGALGVDMGRNIFQSDNPIGMVKAVRAIVHKGMPGTEAYEIYKKR